MPNMSGGDAAISALLAHGIDTIYALPGVQSDHFFNAIFDTNGAMSVIHTRHEQGAGYMALGAAIATGKPSAYCVVPGPGFLNSTAALCTAQALNARVVAISSQIPLSAIGKGFGVLHEIPDQMAIMRQLTKWAGRADTPADAPGQVAAAFQAMLSGRASPVGLELPADMLKARGEVTPVAPLAVQAPPKPLPADLEKAADLIAKAGRPLIFAGGGALHAGAEIKALADLTGIRVVGHRQGRGILDARHPLSITQAEAYGLWKDCDLVVSIGSRVSLPLTVWGTDDRLKLVRIDIDEAEMARYRKPDALVIADAKEATGALVEQLRGKSFDTKARIAESLRHREEFAKKVSVLEPQLAYLRVLREALGEDGILLDDLTQVGYVSRIAYPVYKPRTFLNSGYMGTLGWGVATALGVKHAVPDKPVVVISGDGGFMYNVQELSTAVRHRIPAIFICFNDSAFGNVRRMQKELHGNRVLGSDLLNPDFLKLADAYGLAGYRARSPEELRRALDKALAAGEPALIEVPIGEVPSPWSFIEVPRIRG
ncbi:MAG: hypothetical protein FJX29_08220 [Alphaproteobacteria bacterium]|nr:hypothetical protein [Alphaproteobacteria bacterium]